jgi:hypothetical protein
VIGPGYLVYISGQGKRDDAKVRAFSSVMGLAPYDAKMILGAAGPRRVASLAKEEAAQEKALQLRQAGFVSFVIDKDRFSRAPQVFRARKAVEDGAGLMFTIETAPAPGEINARVMDLPQPKGFVRAAVVGYYTQTTTYSDGSKAKLGASTSSKSHVRDPFIHLYAEDPHTILEIRGPKFECAWLHELGSVLGDARWLKLAERFGSFYSIPVDTTLFRVPEEAGLVTAVLNVDASHGQASSGLAGAAVSQDDSPVVMAASRVIVYSLVFGV